MKPFPDQLNLFFNALVFFTRIPAPQGVDFSAENLNRASRYFPLVGAFVGLIAALVWWCSAQFFPNEIAILLSMAATLLATGCFHEDGLADCADGFGGGWEKSQVLEIMKDSRIGTYGTVVLIIALGLKFAALNSITELVSVLILGHCLSRFASVYLIYKDDYVQEDLVSKAKPLASKIDRQGLMIAALPAALVLILMASVTAWLVVIPVILITLACSQYFRKRIDGYTGDCLGTCQQLNEIAIYLWFSLSFIG